MLNIKELSPTKKDGLYSKMYDYFRDQLSKPHVMEEGMSGYRVRVWKLLFCSSDLISLGSWSGGSMAIVSLLEWFWEATFLWFRRCPSLTPEPEEELLWLDLQPISSWHLPCSKGIIIRFNSFSSVMWTLHQLQNFIPAIISNEPVFNSRPGQWEGGLLFLLRVCMYFMELSHN